MYPDLSYLFHDIFGTALDNWTSVFKTFGFFLALAFLASALVYYAELKRKARLGVFTPIPETFVEGAPAAWSEVLANALVGFILGGKGWLAFTDFEHFRPDPAAVILSKQLHWPAAIIGALLLGGLTWWDAWRRRTATPTVRTTNVWPHDRISEMTVWAAVGGILGSKFFDLFDNWSSFLQDPIGSLASGGGLAFFGGLIFGFVAVVWYQWTKKIPFLHAADAVAPALVAGYGVGRIGCQLSGDGCWGVVNSAPKPGWMSFLPDWMWAYRYPNTVLAELERPTQDALMLDKMKAVRIEGFEGRYPFQLELPVFPTPFYEALMMLAIFGILWALRKRIKIPGMIFCIYLVLISIERFCIEKIRVNVPHDWFGLRMTQAEFISSILILVGVIGAAIVWRMDKAGETSNG